MSANPKEYNGWSNYETWCVNLWLTNEQGTCDDLSDIIRQSKNGEDGENGIGNASLRIQDYVKENMVPDLGAAMAADMLGAAMCEVDWFEIAENHMEDEP